MYKERQKYKICCSIGLVGLLLFLALLGLGDNLAVGDGMFLLVLRDKLALLRHLLHPLALGVLREAVVGNLARGR